MKKIILLILITGTLYGQSTLESEYIVDYNAIELPKTPNAASMLTYGNTPINLAVGKAQINIPIFSLEVDGVTVPISISYDPSGIKVDDLASCVGLKWSLNAGGGIFRNVRNIPDEDGWLTSQWTSIPPSHYALNQNTSAWQFQTAAMAGTRDHNPDIFSYSFLNYSGGFFFKPNGELLLNTKDKLIMDWYDKAYDYEGNEYTFGSSAATQEKSRNQSIHVSITPGNQASVDGYDYPTDITTGWMLETIKTKNNQVIQFEYENYDLGYTWNQHSHNLAMITACDPKHGEPSHYGKISKSSTIHNYKNKLIKKISSEVIEVMFNYSTDSSLSLWQRQLDEILIKDLITNTIIKRFEFDYGIFNGDPRLKLTQLTEVGLNNISKPPHKFFYNTAPLPSKNTVFKDFFGFYNGTSGPRNSLVHRSPEVMAAFNISPGSHISFMNNNTGTRTVDESFLQNGVLEKIEYPTGGNTLFLYEANKIQSKYCGGLRIKEIYDQDVDLKKYQQKKFYYYGLEGLNMESNIHLTKKTIGSSPYFYSNFVDRPDVARSGYYYKKVVTETYFNGNIEFTEESNFQEDGTTYGQIKSQLKSKKYYNKSNELIKSMDYEYDYIGTTDSFNWLVMADQICRSIESWGVLGYTTGWNHQIVGNTALLPIKIATTEFRKTTPLSALEPVTVVNELTYNDDDLNTLKETKSTKLTRSESAGVVSFIETNPTGEVLEVDYEYVDDYSLTTLPKGLVVSKEVKRNGSQIYGQFLEYDVNGNMTSAYNFNKAGGTHTGGANYVPNHYERTVTYLYNQGKPTQVKGENNISTAYIWDSTNTYLLAQVVNATFTTASSYISGSLDLTNPTNIVNQIDNIRQGLSSAQVTTYIYDPLIGVTQVIDPKGYTMNYHYDDLHRLEYVIDGNGNVLSENEYNYGTN
tara:strand:- start:405915 stop:408668 length:2754 start_codon:yes stop_codon:yes gene_type:complete